MENRTETFGKYVTEDVHTNRETRAYMTDRSTDIQVQGMTDTSTDNPTTARLQLLILSLGRQPEIRSVLSHYLS